MQIQIDIREKELIALSKENTNTNYDIIHKSLPIGDVILTKDGKELVIIERKTVKDLAASIKDGRYKEQSAMTAHSYKFRSSTFLLKYFSDAA